MLQNSTRWYYIFRVTQEFDFGKNIGELRVKFSGKSLFIPDLFDNLQGMNFSKHMLG